MSDLKVLYSLREERRARDRRALRARRAKRRRRIRRAVAVMVLAVGTLIVLSLLTTGTTGTTGTTATTKPHGRPVILSLRQRAAQATTDKPKPRVYGALLDPVQVNPKLKLGLKAGLLFDVRSGKVLWERDPSRRLPIASLTKMMTALLVVTHSSPRAHVLITKQAVDFTGSGVGLLPKGKRVPEVPLLYGLLLPSGNDAAIALAQHVAGTQDRFISLMNATARRMGLTCTHYATVSGVIDRDNYSCPQDLAVLAHAVLRQPLLRRIVGSSTATERFPIKGGKLYLSNNNPLMLAGYPGVDGIKTGFTTAAGLCLVATARQDGQWLGVVLLHSGNWLTQAETLLDAGFAALQKAGRHAAAPAHP